MYNIIHMGFFRKSSSGIRYGVLVDIGSGSVLASIVSSDPSLTYPEIIWSKREYTPLRQISSINDSAKSVMTSLMTSLISLDSEGRKICKEKVGHSKLSYLQVTIAAPWSYTNTKTITYQNDEPFEISKELISELQRTADQKTEEEIQENETLHDNELSVVAKTTMQIIANDYPLLSPNNQKASTLKVIEASAITQDYVIAAIKDAKEKMLTGTKLTQYSFMLPYFFVMQEINEPDQDYCLVDITYEATEIGLVRNGVLTYCTHTPYGAFSIAREVSNILSVPLEEAFGYLQDFELRDLKQNWTAAQKEGVDAVIEAFQQRLSQLFRDTGDTLAVPKRIYVHGNMDTEPFFNEQILTGAKSATKMQHAVYNVSKELLIKHYPSNVAEEIAQSGGDTALLISAQFFHNAEYSDKFEQF